MKVSLRWITDFVDLPTSDVAELEDVLSNLGIEVEGYETVELGFEGVVVAKVLAVGPHPDADKIRIATLDTGDGELDVVCGAWNFDAGATIAYAAVGSVLPGGIEVGRKEIRGVESPGMIASERELGLGDDHEGILVLPDDHAPLGTDFASTLPYPDVVFDLSITPNRPDAMSVHGVARDLAAHYGIEVRRPEPVVEPQGPPTTASVIIEDPERCPRFTAREIRDVTIGPSPLWMRLRLRDAGLRPISNVVDITNYVMLELGQPLHAFDNDRVPDQTIVVRRAEPGETLQTLDGVDRTFVAEDLLIASPQGALGVAGVMGGATSEVADDTTTVLLEVAHFDAPSVLLTGKRLGLRTDAVARFERGVDPELPPLASARAAELMVELAGATVADGFIDEHPRPFQAPVVELPVGEVERLLGIEIVPDQIVAILTRLGFGVEGDGPWQVTVPSYRPDVTRPADLVEEIARLHGYDRIPSTLPKGIGGGLPAVEELRRRVRQVMVGAGFFETMSYDFIGGPELDGLGLPDDDRRRAPVLVRNPLNEEQEFLRTSLLPGLLRGLQVNVSRNLADPALFEIGLVYFPSDDALPVQPEQLAFLATGSRPGPTWAPRESRDASDAVGLVETLLTAVGVPYRLEPSADPGFHPGRCARVVIGGEVAGVVGEIHPSTAANWDLEGRVAGGFIEMDAIRGGAIGEFVMPSTYPPVVFDLAFDVAETTTVASLDEVVRDNAGEHLERLDLFDVFRGAPLEDGRKSLAYRLTFRDAERTLTDEELAPVREAIAAAVADTLDGRLRGG